MPRASGRALAQFRTRWSLKTRQNKRAIVPNGQLSHYEHGRTNQSSLTTQNKGYTSPTFELEISSFNIYDSCTSHTFVTDTNPHLSSPNRRYKRRQLCVTTILRCIAVVIEVMMSNIARRRPDTSGPISESCATSDQAMSAIKLTPCTVTSTETANYDTKVKSGFAVFVSLDTKNQIAIDISVAWAVTTRSVRSANRGMSILWMK